MNPDTGRFQPLQYSSLRAEAFCAALLDNGYYFDNITIKYTGAFRRTYRSDINDVTIQDDLRSSDEQLELELNRDSLYDLLPEGLFHQSMGSSRTAGLQDMVVEHRRYKEEERAARKFFQPIEQEMFRYAVYAEQEERAILFGTLSGNLPDSFYDFWSIDPALPKDAAGMLIRLMPLQQRIKGNIDLTSRALSLVLGKPVTAKELVVDDHWLPGRQNGFQPGTDCRLGINSVMGQHFNEPGLQWIFYIDDLNAAEISSCRDGQPLGLVLERFREIFIPLDAEAKFEIAPVKNSGQPVAEAYIMGYGFYL